MCWKAHFLKESIYFRLAQPNVQKHPKIDKMFSCSEEKLWETCRVWNALFKVKTAVILIRRIQSDKNLPNVTLYPLKPDFSPQILSRINGKLGDAYFNSSSLLLPPRASPTFSTHSPYFYRCKPADLEPSQMSHKKVYCCTLRNLVSCSFLIRKLILVTWTEIHHNPPTKIPAVKASPPFTFLLQC